ncbi:MAG: MBOAT family protein [Lachnospiraceae bacterium]|nr:MBOAT family protein [Lachnospiraceae bacterium]
MLFNSYIFILLFLPVVLLGYYGLNRLKLYKAAMGLLVIMSMLFYGYNNPAYLPILIVSVLFNYGLTRAMYAVEQKSIANRLCLTLGLLFNVGLLFYFKYFDFFLENMNAAFRTDFVLRNIVLPLGISFFTFQQLSYVIDSYRRECECYPFLEYASFVTFFPQLIAGPIVLHEELIPQFQDIQKKQVDYENLSKGFYAFARGLGKKVLLADTFSQIVNAGMYNLEDYNATEIIIVMLCYTLQIYFDFSGYCDMAYGIGYMFNVKLPMNFNSPYKADSIADFWKRWHMTLTRFFTKYVYIPLGGNRKGTVRTYVNTLIVFLISGLWHGANWTFILWGLLNGICICFNKLTDKIWKKVPKCIRVGVTFGITNVLWLLFRETNIGEWKKVMRSLIQFRFGGVTHDFTDIINDLTEVRILARFGLNGFITAYPVIMLVALLLLALIVVFKAENTQEKVEKFHFSKWELLITVGLTFWCVASLSQISEFLYFNF